MRPKSRGSETNAERRSRGPQTRAARMMKIFLLPFLSDILPATTDITPPATPKAASIFPRSNSPRTRKNVASGIATANTPSWMPSKKKPEEGNDHAPVRSIFGAYFSARFLHVRRMSAEFTTNSRRATANTTS